MDFKKADCIRGWDIKNAHTKRVNRRIMMITLDSQLFSVVVNLIGIGTLIWEIGEWVIFILVQVLLHMLPMTDSGVSFLYSLNVTNVNH